MKNTLDAKIKLLSWLCLALVIIHVVNTSLQGALASFGIFPGKATTLPYIFTAPFIHGSWGHLINNLFGLSIFSALCLLRSTRFYLRCSVFIIILTGVLVWLFGRQAVHIGASGWIFGLWSLIISMAWFERRFVNIVIALFVVFFYGGMVWGVLPSNAEISFESHLFGAIAGIACAYLYSRNKKRFT